MTRHFLRRAAAFCILAVSLHAAEFTAGMPVEVLWAGTWFKAKVVAVEDGKWKISYDGYGSSWNESVGPDRIRARGADAPAPAAGVAAIAGVPAATAAEPAFVFPARPAGKRAGLQGAYLRVESWYSNGSLSFTNDGWFFTAEGRVSHTPRGGFNFDDFKLTKVARKSDGVYWIDGDTLTIAWAEGGTPGTYKFGTKGSEIQINGVGCTPVEGFKRGWRTDALYEGGASSSSGGSYLAASNSLQFHRDGTFGGDAVSSMSITSSTSNVSGGSTSSTAGTYEFDGYTLTLKHAGGQVEKRTVFAFSDRNAQGAPEYIWREGTMMHRLDPKK